MDEIDRKQQDELDALRDAAGQNKNIDTAQWVALAAVAIGFSVYVNVILGKALSVQGSTIQRLTERCK